MAEYLTKSIGLKVTLCTTIKLFLIFIMTLAENEPSAVLVLPSLM